ncbi:MAG TPA: hypothetical protein DCL61_07440 [Cyanobacteria bacterium UBA12227]|nr:hypothetical protein [Cyanobacteria bacterium UBA12227]HAJ60761.1 hypothetical protein [Cyanobacteria bacterium UBA8543]
MSNSRGDIDLVGHNIISIPAENVGPLPSIDNIIVKADSPEKQWIEDVTQQIGDWRAKLRSTYIRWALSINGLHIAAEKYADPELAMHHKFTVTSLRPDDDQNINPCVIAEWDGLTASDAHRKTIPMLTAFGIIDLYANLEEVIFALYRTYLNYHPEQLLQGNEFRELRRLKREAEADSLKCNAWETAWQKRLNDWQRKKIYDGLGQVFKRFCNTAGIKTPSTYKQTTVETWAKSIDIVSFVRNALIHGETIVSEELETLCTKTKPYACGFDFKSGEPLVIQLIHLQRVDLFCEQLLSALNISLCELAFKQN